MTPWWMLVLSLPTENATARMRAWRALKAAGAAVLRDGVYLLPRRDDGRAVLAAVAAVVRAAGGSAHLLAVEPAAADAAYAALFDRGAEFAALLGEIVQARDALATGSAAVATAPAAGAEATRRARKLRKAFDALVAIDFFPAEAQRQTGAALAGLEQRAHSACSPGEPSTGSARPAGGTAIRRLDAAAFQGRRWATRERPWVDRLACAWLIRRHIDPAARFVWLAAPVVCPRDAVGFDFDGARFSHVGAKVTFEVLLAAFGLEQPALQRLGALVHFLDVGGVEPPEASGIERVLTGLREALADDDDRLMQVASGVFEGLHVAFEGAAAAAAAP